MAKVTINHKQEIGLSDSITSEDWNNLNSCNASSAHYFTMSY